MLALCEVVCVIMCDLRMCEVVCVIMCDLFVCLAFMAYQPL